MSITNTKSIIINELWKWASYKSRWARYIVSRIIKKEEPLSNEERNIAFNLFLDSIGLKNNDFSYNEKIQLPDMIFNPKDFKLLSIKDVKGVNKLAPNQELVFGDNITVVYGENGTGKSGYGRILKSLGVSYDEELDILCNVYNDEDEDQSAIINYEVDKIEKEITWEKKFHLDELKSISFFNNKCVNISLNSERKLIITPIGFYLFELVSEELNEISLLLKEYISNLETDFDLLSQLNEGTDSYKLILQLDYKTKVEDIEKLVFLEKDENNLLEKKKNLKDLNKKLIENNIKSITKEVKELNKIKEKLEYIRNLNIKEIVNELKRSLEEESKLKNIKSNSLRDIIEEKNIKLFDSDEFINFIKSADDYIKKIGNESYPEDEEDICIYCRQKLKDKESIKLIKSYRKLLNDDKEIKLKRVQNRIKKIKDIIAKLDDELIFVHEAFGVDSKNEAIQPELMKEFNEHIKLIKELVFNNSLDELENYFDINELIELIDNKYKKKKEKLIELEEKIPEVEKIEERIQNKINELEDKKTIYQKREKIISEIKRLKTLRIIEINKKRLSTRSISKIVSRLRDSLIKDNFTNIFEKELSNLKRSNINIDLDFKTKKGKSIIKQYIKNSYRLSHILSEGEQKTIALSEFLTEIQMDQNKAPVIFDDPVTSLDHKIIDNIANRLLQLSENRQVIIFTHSILMFNSLIEKSKKKRFNNADSKCYEVQKDTNFSGYIYETKTLKNDTYKKYKSEINDLLNSSKEKRIEKESEIACSCYSKLRSAIEVFLEKEALVGTVERYKKNVSVTNIERVNGELIDSNKEDIITVFENCCKNIEGHSSATPLLHSASLEEFIIDFEKMNEIRKKFVS